MSAFEFFKTILEKQQTYLYCYPSKSFIPKTPFFPITHSAAITAPSANPSRLNASWVIVILSTSELYTTVCVPGTSSIRLETIINSS